MEEADQPLHIFAVPLEHHRGVFAPLHYDAVLEHSGKAHPFLLQAESKPGILRIHDIPRLFENLHDTAPALRNRGGNVHFPLYKSEGRIDGRHGEEKYCELGHGPLVEEFCEAHRPLFAGDQYPEDSDYYKENDEEVDQIFAAPDKVFHDFCCKWFS